MWLTTFTTRQGNFCIRFASRILSVQACAAAKPLAELVKRYPKTSGTVGIILPVLIQLYLASRQPKK